MQGHAKAYKRFSQGYYQTTEYNDIYNLWCEGDTSLKLHGIKCLKFGVTIF